MEKWVNQFARRVEREALPVEAVMAFQDGRLVAGRRWTPDVPRNIYSHTKSFLATAAGIAIGDGFLSLEDRPAEMFPEALPADAPAALGRITLRHLLTMSSGFGVELLMSPTRTLGVGAPDYLRHVLSQPLRQPPGVLFHYSNGDSYVAGRMIECRTGQTLRDFLQARLFDPLGIVRPDWEEDPQGHTFGASGLRLRTGDMAKLGLLYLAEGLWAGQRIVSADWVRTATALHIQTPDSPNNPWSCGYGYQFWRSPYPEAYRADGSYGQITTVLPRAGAVVAIQCAESDRFPAIRAALHEEILCRL